MSLKPNYVALVATLVVGLPYGAMAQSGGDSGSFIDWDGQLNVDVNYAHTDGDTNGENLSLRRSFIRANMNLMDSPEYGALKAVIRAELDEQFKTDGDSNDVTIDIDSLIKEAYIMWDSKSGVCFVIGKHEVAFGQNYAGRPAKENNPLERLLRVDGVIGATVALDAAQLAGIPSWLLKSLEVSAFETKADDLSNSGIDGYSVRTRHNLTFAESLFEVAQLTLSYMKTGDEAGTPDETRMSAGVFLKSGKWAYWGELLKLEDNATYANSDYGVTAGVSRSFGEKGQKLSLEVTHIENELNQVAVGYKFPLAGFMIGPEVSYTRYDDGATSGPADEDSLGFGIRATAGFGSGGGKKPANPNAALDATSGKVTQ